MDVVIIFLSLTCRSSVHSSMIEQPNLVSYENRQMIEQASNNDRVIDANLGNSTKGSRPPPRVPGGTKLPCQALIAIVYDSMIFSLVMF